VAQKVQSVGCVSCLCVCPKQLTELWPRRWHAGCPWLYIGNSKIKVISFKVHCRRRKQQEAQLSPSDRAMRLVSSNLANCHVTVQKLLIRQILTKLMVWSWRFSRRQCVMNNVHSTMTRPGWFGGTQGQRQCHHSIERIRLPIRL